MTALSNAELGHARLRNGWQAGIAGPCGRGPLRKAVKLIRRSLEGTVVEYQDPFQSLDIVLPQARDLGPVTADRDASAMFCHLACEQPADITGAATAGRVADTAAALLRAVAAVSM